MGALHRCLLDRIQEVAGGEVNIALVVLVVYMVAIGLWTARLPQSTDKDYLLGGR